MDKNTSRFEAFSDGVFAVALTLLALEIRLPESHELTNAELWGLVLSKWPEYLTFLNAFAVVFLVWLGHHRLVDKLRDTNQPLMLANAWVLFLVALFPYPARTAGLFMQSPAAEGAVLVFVCFTALMVLSMMGLNVCIQRSPHLLRQPEHEMPVLKRLMRLQWVGLLAYLSIAVVAIYAAYVAIWLTVVVWIFWGYATWHDPQST